jgi:hypothetical protein
MTWDNSFLVDMERQLGRQLTSDERQLLLLAQRVIFDRNSHGSASTLARQSQAAD